VAQRPAVELVTPATAAPIPELVSNIMGQAQYVSPAYWVGWVFEQATGTNPWQWIVDSGPAISRLPSARA
jgi:hypothetical protein